VHVDAEPTAYSDYPLLRDAYGDAVSHFQCRYHHSVRSARNHTVDWVGWIGPAKIEAEFGTELDLNYYHYWDMSQQGKFPDLRLPTDKSHANGYFTGSGLPQRFCDENGAVLAVYQLLTEWPDEFFGDNGFSAAEVVPVVKSMLAAAADGYYSAFVANIHPIRYAGSALTDTITGSWAPQLWAHAQAEGIPVWTAARFLDFTAARQEASFPNLSWDPSTLAFNFGVPMPTNDLTVMVPGDGLVSVAVDGDPVTPTMETIAGRSVAFLTAIAAGAHVVARYA
jgi:hypothetical protein